MHDITNRGQVFPGVKLPGCGVINHPLPALRLQMSSRYTSTCLLGLHRNVMGVPYLFIWNVALTPHPLLVSWSWKGRATPLLPLWAARPVQSLSACTRVHFTSFFFTCLWQSDVNTFAQLCDSRYTADQHALPVMNGCYQSSWQEIALYSYTSSLFGSAGWTLCHKTCLVAPVSIYDLCCFMCDFLCAHVWGMCRKFWTADAASL
jgi:hypothetical protein